MKSIFRCVGVPAGICLIVMNFVVLLTGRAVAVTASTADAGLDEIVVTAERRDESLSKTPVSVTVLSADTLAKAQIGTENDLRAALPGLAIRNGANSNQINFSLRGESQDAFSNTRPGVMPYINDVQVGGTGTSSAFYDLQSVQVLKGPQGTLFGRSATGGAVLFTTAQPTDTFGGYASMVVGNYRAQKFESAVNLPIDEHVSVRVAGFEQTRRGYQLNLYSGHEEGSIDRFGGRVTVLVKLTDNLRNSLVVDYFHADNTSVQPVIGGLLPFTGTPPPYVPLAALYAGTATPQARSVGIGTVAAFTGAPLGAVTAFYDAYFANPKHPAGGLTGIFADQQARGPYVADVAADDIFQARNTIVTDTTTYNFNDDNLLKNIFGFSHVDTTTAYDNSGTPYLISANGPLGAGRKHDVQLGDRQVSDEIQLQGKAWDHRLDYVAGFYFSDELYNSYQPGTFFDILFGGLFTPYHYVVSNRTYAPFAQTTYHINDSGLSATLGVRYTSEKVGIQTQSDDANVAILGPVPPPGYSYDQFKKYNRTSWHAGLQDQISSDWLFYVSSGQSFKAGGFNGSGAPKIGNATVAGNAYDAESVKAAEIGAKFEGTLFNLPTRFNVAVYRNWIKNSQRLATTIVDGSPAGLTVNVPHGVTQGLELDGLIKPLKYLALGASVNYTDAYFSHAPVYANGVPQIYDQVPDTPRFSGTVFVDLALPVSDHLNVILHEDTFVQSRTFLSPQSQNNNGTILPQYALTAFRAGVESDQGWSVLFNMKNAFNRVYYAGGVPFGVILQDNTLVPGEPRTYTVEGRYKF